MSFEMDSPLDPVRSPARQPGGEAGTEAVQAGLGVDHPLGELDAGVMGEGAAEEEGAEVSDGCVGAGGVAGVTGCGEIQVGLGAVKAGDGVAEGAAEGSIGRRTAEVSEEEVGGGIVGLDQGGGAEVVQRHGVAGVGLGEGGVAEEGFGWDWEFGVQGVLIVVDSFEDGGYEEELEGAAHGEAFVGAMACGLVGKGVQDGDAKAAVVSGFDLSECGGEGVELWDGGGEEAWGEGEGGGGGEEGAAGEHVGQCTGRRPTSQSRDVGHPLRG